MSTPVRVIGSGAVCAIGLSVQQIWAAARAGISRSSSSYVHDRNFQPITMALLPDDVMPDVPKLKTEAALTAAQERILRLARMALTDAFGSAPQQAPVPLFLGLPEAAADSTAPAVDSKTLLSLLAKYSSCPIQLSDSHVFPRGRASAMEALVAATQYLAEAPNRTVVVGGADTFLDLKRLSDLDVEGRILSEQTMDGFTPGEGAAFLILTNSPVTDGLPSTILLASATANDKGHRYSDEPGLGEGLANAVELMRTKLGTPRSPAELIFAGFNGEGFGAKEWGVAQLRHQDILSPQAALEHPADRFADIGAAMGAMLLALADAALLLGHREGPALIWASSDHELCGCAWLELSTG